MGMKKIKMGIVCSNDIIFCTSVNIEIANNVVFLQFVNAFFMRKRVTTMRDFGFEIKDIWYIDTPKKPWPQTGFQVGCIYWSKG